MSLKVILVVALVAIAVEAKPRYFAIPLEDLRLVRHARSAPAYEHDYAPVINSNRRPIKVYAPEERPDQVARFYPQASQTRPVYVQRPQPSERRQVYAQRPQASERRPVYVQHPQASKNVAVFVDENEEHLVPESSDRYERQSGGYGHGDNDHVDYGAYTGGYGAFGWYSDHPVCVNCGYH